MLQLADLNARAWRALPDHVLRAPADGGAALEARVDDAIAQLRDERRRQARRSLGARVAEAVDRAIRTDAIEHMDRPDVPEARKLGMVRGVHLMNVATLSYRRFLAFLAPRLEAVARREGRPARLLEIASGAGGLALEFAALAEKRGLPVEVTGSDVVPLYVATANAAAARRGVRATFRRLDALDTQGVASGAYDVVLIAQSTHHFTPGQVARMIGEARRIATTSFVSIDGWRSLHMLAFVGGTSLLSFHPWLVHDAWVTARKFYSEPELRAIATLAAPGANVGITRLWPLNSALTVDFREAP